MWCQAGSIFTGQCPWAVSGKVWQMLRAAVAVGAVYTGYSRHLDLDTEPPILDTFKVSSHDFTSLHRKMGTKKARTYRFV